MASLWAMIRSERCNASYDSNFFSLDDIERLTTIWRSNFPRPTLVNLTAYWNEWIKEFKVDFDMARMDATPGFEVMWFEWIWNGERQAVAVHRYKLDPASMVEGEPKDGRFLMQLTMLSEQDGRVVFSARAIFYLDQMGCQVGTMKLSSPKGTTSEDLQGQIMIRVLLVCEALTDMNTHGTRIEPPLNSPEARVVKPNRVPCSVWHTIHLPRVASQHLEGAEISPEVLERREHWVKATRKDYRFGKGLFGRVKSLVWVPEHKRGNPELGTVCQSYKVERVK